MMQVGMKKLVSACWADLPDVFMIFDSTSEYFQDRPDFNDLVAPLKALPCALPTQPKPYIIAYTPTDYEDVELEDKVVCLL